MSYFTKARVKELRDMSPTDLQELFIAEFVVLEESYISGSVDFFIDGFYVGNVGLQAGERRFSFEMFYPIGFPDEERGLEGMGLGTLANAIVLENICPRIPGDLDLWKVYHNQATPDRFNHLDAMALVPDGEPLDKFKDLSLDYARERGFNF